MTEHSNDKIDTLLHAKWVVPVDGKHRYLEQHSIAIHENKIIDILPTSLAKKKYNANTNRTYEQHALIPGLINSHGLALPWAVLIECCLQMWKIWMNSLFHVPVKIIPITPFQVRSA